MKRYFYVLLVVSIFGPQVISSSECLLEQFLTCMSESSPPSQCAVSSGCDSSIEEYFTNINAMNHPIIFKYTASPHVGLTNVEVNFDTLNHNEFRDSSPHFPLSRVFTVTRDSDAGAHSVSLMMPTYLDDAEMCNGKQISLTPLANHVPGSGPLARVEACQTMVLTSVCICFVNMFTEAGSFVMTSEVRHPLAGDDFNKDLRRRLEGEGEGNLNGEGQNGGEGEGREETRDEEGGGGQKDDDLDVDFITHTALVILTVVAFIGNGLFLTYVFCISAV